MTQIYLTKDEISFIIDGIAFFNNNDEVFEQTYDGEYVSGNGTYRLTSEQINQLNEMLQYELKSMP